MARLVSLEVAHRLEDPTPARLPATIARGAVRHGIEPEAPPTFVSLLAAVFWIVVAGLLIVCRGEGMAEWKALGEALCAAGLALWALCG